jgi:hypothetical protein
MMFNPQELVIERFAAELEVAYRQTYTILEPEFANIIGWTGRLALENIANSNSLYHNIDHTIMVTLAGQAILKGKHLCEGGVTPRDWLEFIIALLCHDIGFVRGLCRDDSEGMIATGVDGKTVAIPLDWTDAVLAPYHVDRSKLFVRERFGGKLFFDINVEVIASYIEMTRFPVPDREFYKDTKSYAGLLRAADFIGQLGDPNYLRKIPALYYELEEAGANAHTGYKSPGDTHERYTQFYYDAVAPYIQKALTYLRVTQEGKQWIANLHSHVFSVEHDESLSTEYTEEGLGTPA